MKYLDVTPENVGDEMELRDFETGSRVGLLYIRQATALFTIVFMDLVRIASCRGERRSSDVIA